MYGARMNIATTRSKKTVKGAITYRTIGNGDKCSKVWKSETVRPKTYLLAEKALDMYGRILDIGEVTSAVCAPSPCADDAVCTMFSTVDDMVAGVWRKGMATTPREYGYVSKSHFGKEVVNVLSSFFLPLA